MILLTHPVHGSKFALSEAEVKIDEENGWVRYTANAAPVAAPVERVKRKWTRRASETPVEQPNGGEPVSDESEGE